MTHPLISIILPVHNGEPYLHKAVQSIFCQTYPHFELIVLENASTDQTPALLSALDDPRMQVIPSSQLLSIGENWKRASQLQLSPYVTFLSHDDLLAPTFLETIVKLIDKHPDASVYTTHFNLINAEGEVLRLCKTVPYIESAESFLLATQQHLRDSYGTGYVLQSKIFLELGGIPQLPNLMFADDLMYFQVAQKSYKVCDPTIQFDYRYHADSTARLTSIAVTFAAAIQYLDHLNDNGFMDKTEHQKSAHKYVEDILTRRHRSLLLSLLAFDNASRDRYLQEIASLRQHPRWTGDHDVIVAIFTVLLKLPAPIRRLSKRLIKQLVDLTWHLRNRR